MQDSLHKVVCLSYCGWSLVAWVPIRWDMGRPVKLWVMSKDFADHTNHTTKMQHVQLLFFLVIVFVVSLVYQFQEVKLKTVAVCSFRITQDFYWNLIILATPTYAIGVCLCVRVRVRVRREWWGSRTSKFISPRAQARPALLAVIPHVHRMSLGSTTSFTPAFTVYTV